MSRFDVYYAYQLLHRIAHTISQAEYRRIDAELFAALRR